jgi:hypothetical protein
MVANMTRNAQRGCNEELLAINVTSEIAKKPKKCLICGKWYDLVKEVNGYMLYSHSDLKHNHEYGEKIV